MPQDPQTIAREALALPAPQRRAFVERTCAHDADLRERVDRLMTLMAGATIAPETNGAHSASPASREPSPERGERWIGRYRVLDEIGAGAMGVVYLAEQQTPRRRIALKVIRPDGVTEALRARFEQETRTLARLRHPAIAAIYDAGNARVDGADCPYFAMELVTGSTLDAHARARPLRERIGLLREVCAGVEHAHQRGVIHRDLKPANILVDESGRPRILDFGVARALDAEEGPRPELVGTLPYMSPEQLRADPDTDTRADVYALGVILCELVTGRRPHDVDNMTSDGAARYLAETPPAPLRALDPEAPRDLGAIAARALAREPDDRYPSAAAMGEDLGRWLAREPVEARPRRVGYVATRFAQRNTGLVVAGALGLLAIAGGVAGVSWQAVEATRGWARAQEEAQRVRAINGFFTDMLTSADPENAMGEELTVRELLDAASRAEARDLDDNPSVEAVVRLAIASTYRGLGELRQAEAQARDALDASVRAFGVRDANTAEARQALGVTLLEQGRLDEARRELQRALGVIERLYGADSIEACATRGELARVAYNAGDHEEALAMWKGALDRAERLVGLDDNRALVLMHNYGSALGALGRFDEAIGVLGEVAERRERLFGRDHPQTLGARSMLAGVYQKLERDEEAAGQFRAILAARRAVFGDEHHATYTAKGNLAVALVRLGELEEAERLTREALAGFRDALGPGHAKSLIVMGVRAYILEDMGRADEAAALYREQIALREASTGGRDPETWSTYNNLAMLLQTSGAPGEALPLYERLLALCDEHLPADHYVAALFRNNYGDCLAMLGRHDEAREELARSHAVLVATFGEGHPRVAKSQRRIDALPE